MERLQCVNHHKIPISSYHLLFIIVLLPVILGLTNKVYSQTDELMERYQNVVAVSGEDFFITPPVVYATGTWEIRSWDQAFVHPKEKRQNIMSTTFVFSALQEGETDIILEYVQSGTATQISTYHVNISGARDLQSDAQTAEEAVESQNQELETLSSIPIPLEDFRDVEAEFINFTPYLSYELSGEEIEEIQEAPPPSEDEQQIRINYRYFKTLFDQGMYEVITNQIGEYISTFNQSQWLYDFLLIELLSYLNQDQSDPFFSKIEEYQQTYQSDDLLVGKLKLLKAKVHLNREEFAQAAALFLELISTRYEEEICGPALYGLSQTYLLTENPDYHQAIASLSRLVNDYPHSELTPLAYYTLGQLYFNIDRVEDYYKAYDAFDTLCQNFPRSPYYEQSKRNRDYLSNHFIHIR